MSPSKPQFLHLQSRDDNDNACIIIIHRAVKSLNEVTVPGPESVSENF